MRRDSARSRAAQTAGAAHAGSGLADAATDSAWDSASASMGVLSLASGTVALPAFLPDATLGVVRSVDSTDLESVGVEAVVMSVFHLMQKPGSSTIAALGGLHRMAGWTRPIVTDSGGFQAYSMIRQNAKFGSIGDNGLRFKPEGSDRDFQLTPEKSIQLQLAYGGDIVVCLDDCTHVQDSDAEQQLSVERTVRWARRCKEEFVRQIGQPNRRKETARPLLYGVVQGGGDPVLRRRCAEELLEIGFDGYGYGGWPLDAEGNLVREMLALCRDAIPDLPHARARYRAPAQHCRVCRNGVRYLRFRASNTRRAHGTPLRLRQQSLRPVFPLCREMV